MDSFGQFLKLRRGQLGADVQVNGPAEQVQAAGTKITMVSHTPGMIDPGTSGGRPGAPVQDRRPVGVDGVVHAFRGIEHKIVRPFGVEGSRNPLRQERLRRMFFHRSQKPSIINGSLFGD